MRAKSFPTKDKTIGTWFKLYKLVRWLSQIANTKALFHTRELLAVTQGLARLR